MGAPQADGLGGPEGLQPHSRLHAPHAIPSANELLELAAHCERTPHATVGLDRAIWRAAVSTADERDAVDAGLRAHGKAEEEFRISRMMGGRSYSTSIDDALQLIPSGWSVQIGRGWRCDIKEGKAWASVMDRQYGPADIIAESENAATPALALCAAALRALATRGEQQ